MPEFYQLNPTPEQFQYAFGGVDPLLTVPAGSIIEVFTEDCFGGLVTSTDTLPTEVITFPYINPISGPIAVEGAEPGDVLAVHFADTVPTRDWAASTSFPHFGALTTTHTTAMLHDALEERVWIYDVDADAGVVRFTAANSDFTAELPLDPFIGTVGVAPASGERIASITPSAHGGNLDTPEMRAGTTLYLPVNVEGAMLSLGDGHCRQGEGETIGTAVEAALRSTIIVDVIKGASVGWPRIESDEFLMSTGSTKPLEDAFRISQHDLVTWTRELTGLDMLDALQLVSQAGLAPAGNVVDTNYTMLAKLPKSVLGGAVAYDGVHERLRATAAEYLSSR